MTLVPVTFKLWTPVFIAEIEQRGLAGGLYSKIVHHATRIGIGDGALDLNFEFDAGSDKYGRSMLESGDSFNITETMVIGAGEAEPDDPHVFITFTNDAMGLVQTVNLDAFSAGKDFFTDYTGGQSYPSPGEHLGRILDYFLPKINLAQAQERATRIAGQERQKPSPETPTPESAPVRSLVQRLASIEGSMQTLLGIAQGRHEGQRTVLESDEAYLTRLYTNTIHRDRGSLRFFDYNGQRIPYALVQSPDIEGQVGRVFGNLYFVARDLAPHEWQQQIVAVHESLCVAKSHAAARREEIKVARALGKEPEYRAWRETVDTHFNGKHAR